MDLQNSKDYKLYRLTGLEKSIYVLHNYKHNLVLFWKNDNNIFEQSEVHFFFLLLKMFVHTTTRKLGNSTWSREPMRVFFFQTPKIMLSEKCNQRLDIFCHIFLNVFAKRFCPRIGPILYSTTGFKGSE